MKKGLALVVAVAAVAAVSGSGAGSASGSGAVVGPRLTAISARVGGKGASLVVEASEPVPYVVTRPDPLTVLLDFRNVAATDVANSVKADGKSAIAAVAIEAGESQGAPASRVRIRLTQPVGHRVRSEKNFVVVDFEKPSGKGLPYVLPPRAVAGELPDAMQALLTPAPVARTAVADSAAADPIGRLVAPQATRVQAVQAPMPPPAVDQAPSPAQAPATRFTGHPISLDFQGADLRAVLRTFAEVSGLNIVIDPAVTGSVDVALRDVPWDQALDIILRANKLGYLVDGTIIRIAPLSVLSDEEGQRRKLTDEQALAGTLKVLTKTLSYAKAEDMVTLLTKSALSVRGTVQVDSRTNTLIISDLPERLTTAADLIAALDRAQPQVEIEARIVQTTRNYARALGIQWGFTGRVDPALGNTTNLAFPNSGALNGRVANSAGSTSTQTTQAVNLAAPGATSAIGLALGSVNGAFNLDVALSALESSGNGRLLSTPRVTTQNNVEAEIAQGVQIPYQTTANNTVTINFKDAALILKVTPQITASNTVIMKISVDNGSVGGLFNGVPSINTQRANTSVMVDNGQTTVIGGIYASAQQTTNDRTPGLGQVPLLRWLFKRDTTDDKSTELLIFITPRIIKQ